MTSNELDTVA